MNIPGNSESPCISLDFKENALVFLLFCRTQTTSFTYLGSIILIITLLRLVSSRLASQRDANCFQRHLYGQRWPCYFYSQFSQWAIRYLCVVYNALSLDSRTENMSVLMYSLLPCAVDLYYNCFIDKLYICILQQSFSFLKIEFLSWFIM